MKNHYVLIDYENVQPTDLALLGQKPVKVKVFLGANQTKIPVALASALQGLGSNAEYISLESSGRNALDFALAYYLGVIVAENRGGVFHLISKDTGFDPLIRHLKANGVAVDRAPRIGDLQLFKPIAKAKPQLSRLDVVVGDLIKRQASKPRSRKTLLSTIDALFKKALSSEEVAALVDALCQQGIVTVEGSRVAYNLPRARVANAPEGA